MSDLYRAWFDGWSSNEKESHHIEGWGRTRFPDRDEGYVVEACVLRYLERLSVELNNCAMDADRKRDIANFLGYLFTDIERSNRG